MEYKDTIKTKTVLPCSHDLKIKLLKAAVTNKNFTAKWTASENKWK